MLGFQTDWNFECSVFDWTQIGVFLRLGFIAKQRSGFGFDYMCNTRNLYRYKLGKIIMIEICIGISYGK